MAVDDGTTTFHFIYDAETDSWSELDQRTISADGTTYAMTTFGNRRLAFANKADTTGRINRWIQDYDTPAGAFELVTTAWDFDYPVDEKMLFGFEVVQDQSIAAGTISVAFQLDESGTWITTDSAGAAMTTGAGVKYTTFQVSGASTQRKFRILRLRIQGASGARLLSLRTRAYVNSFQEMWKLVLKARASSQRARNAPVKAETVREQINTLASAKDVVTFLDGRRFPRRGGNNVGYTTHTVVVEFPRDGGTEIRRAHGHYEGSVQVVLRSILP
jgi:hypothetical protein